MTVVNNAVVEDTVSPSIFPTWLSEHSDLFIHYGFNIVSALLILLVGHWVIKSVHQTVVKLLEAKNMDAAIIQFIGAIVRYGLMLVVLIAALNQMGIEMASLIAVMASVSLAIGMALKGTLSNFASGILIVVFRPFKSKDFITAGGVSGTVQSIEIFHTVLNTGDNKMLVVPHRKIMSGPITNVSRHPVRRVDMEIRVSYKADLQQAKQLIENILQADERILKTPAPTIGVISLNASSVNIVARPWVNKADYWKVHFDTLQAIKESFEQHQIDIPYQQCVVHVDSKMPL